MPDRDPRRQACRRRPAAIGAPIGDGLAGGAQHDRRCAVAIERGRADRPSRRRRHVRRARCTAPQRTLVSQHRKPAAIGKRALRMASARGAEAARPFVAGSIPRPVPFVAGLAALDAFPLATWRRLAARCWRAGDTTLLGYLPASGCPPLSRCSAGPARRDGSLLGYSALSKRRTAKAVARLAPVLERVKPSAASRG